MNSETHPQLAAPGAGIPWIERRVGSLLFGFHRLTGTPASISARFQREREAIRVLLNGVDEAARGTWVLIRRPPGLEDSSRYWSVWMTLDHLRIVHGAMSRVITELLRGITPPGEASTAAVKPRTDVAADVEAAWERSCDELLAVVAAAPDLRTAARYPHPWFGPLDAAGWHALAAGHMGIHRRQIERIIRGLAGAKAVR